MTMAELIIFCIICVFIITAIFFAWYYYQQARNRERMALIEKGEKLEDIYIAQKRNKFEFVFPWLKLGIITLIMSIGFLVIGFVFDKENHDSEVLLGFIITFILGLFLSISMLVTHFIGKKEKQEDG